MSDDDQKDLFDGRQLPNEAHTRTTDPDTSHQAARRVDATKRERETLVGLRQLGGFATSREISRAIGVHEWSISPRMKPLERKGFVRRTDMRRDKQIVWEYTPRI